MKVLGVKVNGWGKALVGPLLAVLISSAGAIVAISRTTEKVEHLSSKVLDRGQVIQVIREELSNRISPWEQERGEIRTLIKGNAESNKDNAENIRELRLTTERLLSAIASTATDVRLLAERISTLQTEITRLARLIEIKEK